MRRARSTYLALTVAAAVALGTFATTLPAATGAPGGPAAGVQRTASIATLATRDFRVAVVAYRLDGGGAPTAEVRVGLARRVGAGWRELRERRLGETFFWNTVTGPRAVCRLAIARLQVTVQLLQSPSLGCGRTHRVPLPGR